MDVRQVEDSENICGVLSVFVKALTLTLPDKHQFVSLPLSYEQKKDGKRRTLREGESIFCHLADTMHTTCRMLDLISINDYMSKCLYTSWSIRHDATLCFERERRMVC